MIPFQRNCNYCYHSLLPTTVKITVTVHHCCLLLLLILLLLLTTAPYCQYYCYCHCYCYCLTPLISSSPHFLPLSTAYLFPLSHLHHHYAKTIFSLIGLICATQYLHTHLNL